jgi:hypothetical protein
MAPSGFASRLRLRRLIKEKPMQRVSILVLVAALLAGGCTYYRVREPSSGRTYYTVKDLDFKHLDGGGLRFRGRTRNRTVTLQSHELEEISKGQYQRGIHGVDEAD